MDNYYIDLLERLRETLYTFKITLQWDSESKIKDIDRYDDDKIKIALKNKIEANAKVIETLDKQILEINTAVNGFKN